MPPSEEFRAPRAANRRQTVAAQIIFGVLLLVIVVIVILDWPRIRPALRAANWLLLPIGFAFTFLSYVCSSSGYALVNRIFGLRTPIRRLLMVGFVNMTSNNLITLGGVAGLSASAALLKEKETPLRDIMAASMFNSYLYLLFGATFFPLSLIFVILGSKLPGHTLAILLAFGAVVLVFDVIAFLAVFRDSTRRRILGFLSRVIHFIARRRVDIAFHNLDETLTRGISLMKGLPRRAFALAALVTGDWICCITALWFCFAALGSRLNPGILISGFFIGITAGGISMIPGGLGIQEGSMAGVYALLGIPFRQAILASLLFRAVYYIVPFLSALLIYALILREKARAIT